LRLGPFKLGGTASSHRDDPYWDLFVNRAVADRNNLVNLAMADAPEGNVNPVRADLHTPDITAAHLKEFARYLGADVVGVAAVDDVGEDPRPFAVICGVKAEYNPAQSPGVGGQAPAVDTQYISFVVSAYIRELGYRATSVIDPDAVRLAARARLGTADRDGLLVAPKLGRVHVSEIIRTDIPLAVDG
jgi:hypothetical protein